MYVVTRTFRDSNGLFKVGSAVEPTSVRTFKARLAQKHIINVNEHNVNKWDAYFKNRYGLDLSDLFAPLKKEVITQEVLTPVVDVPAKQPIQDTDEPVASTEDLDEDTTDW